MIPYSGLKKDSVYKATWADGKGKLIVTVNKPPPYLRVDVLETDFAKGTITKDADLEKKPIEFIEEIEWEEI
jgi:hypothetical protein